MGSNCIKGQGNEYWTTTPKSKEEIKISGQKNCTTMEGKQGKKALWTAEEDRILMDYVRVHGKGRWSHIPKTTGLKRGGKSCRLRWMNYLCPTVKHEHFTQEEEDLIIRLHNLLGNRWSLIAGRIPGRTDNQVKNHWNTRLCKKQRLIQRNNSKESSIAAGTSSSPPPKASTQGTNLPFLAAASTAGPPAAEEALEKDVGITIEFCEQILGDCCYGCRYWPSDDGVLGDVHAQSLTELVDGYSLDSMKLWDLNSTTLN